MKKSMQLYKEADRQKIKENYDIDIGQNNYFMDFDDFGLFLVNKDLIKEIKKAGDWQIPAWAGIIFIVSIFAMAFGFMFFIASTLVLIPSSVYIAVSKIIKRLRK